MEFKLSTFDGSTWIDSGKIFPSVSQALFFAGNTGPARQSFGVKILPVPVNGAGKPTNAAAVAGFKPPVRKEEPKQEEVKIETPKPAKEVAPKKATPKKVTPVKKAKDEPKQEEPTPVEEIKVEEPIPPEPVKEEPKEEPKEEEKKESDWGSTPSWGGSE